MKMNIDGRRRRSKKKHLDTIESDCQSKEPIFSVGVYTFDHTCVQTTFEQTRLKRLTLIIGLVHK